jgi:hypothetical protein
MPLILGGAVDRWDPYRYKVPRINLETRFIVWNRGMVAALGRGGM